LNKYCQRINKLKFYSFYYNLFANQIIDIAFASNELSSPSYPFTVNDQGALLRATYAMQKRGVAITQDSWDGYLVQRERMFNIFKANTNNLVVLSGDTHNAWAFDLKLGDSPVGVEFSGPSVSSSGYEELTIPFWDLNFGAAGFQMWRTAWLLSNPGLTYSNPVDRGFVLITATQSSMTAEYYFISETGESPFERANPDPWGSYTLAESIWNGNSYCEVVVTQKDSKTTQAGSSCVAQFGQGLAPLQGATNVLGSTSPANPQLQCSVLALVLLALLNVLYFL